MKVLFEHGNDLFTVQIVEEGGKYIVRYEDALTTPAWDRAGINGYYWIHKAEFDNYKEALEFVRKEYKGIHS